MSVEEATRSRRSIAITVVVLGALIASGIWLVLAGVGDSERAVVALSEEQQLPPPEIGFDLSAWRLGARIVAQL